MSFTSQTVYTILAIGAMVAIIANTVASVRLGIGKKKSDADTESLLTIKLKDARILELQKEVDTLNVKVTQDGKDIAVLQSENLQLKAFNANKNPELETLMKQVITALNEQTQAIHALLARPLPATNIINK